nr:precorrin-6y C5,15-methyltransferase (decarboxylating) subunit CbiE [Conexibacter woesei]
MIAVLGVAGGRVPPGTEDVLAGARVVAGGAAVLRALAPAGARQVVLGAGVDAALEELVGVDAVVLASGDPGFFGIVRALRRHVGPEELAVHPAPSSVALAFARLGVPWDDALVVSAHARDPRPALATALRHPKVAILTDGDATPAWFAARLEGRRLAVCARLGLDGETVVTGSASEIAAREWDQPNVVVSLGDAEEPAAVDAWALPEDAFDHRSGMITKREVRAVALAALGPATGRLIWDVGCGSGSVAVECARLGAAVFAIDHDADAVGRTRANAARFGVPVAVVEGVAPMALAALPDPDAVFVGGGGRDVEAILEACAARDTTRAIVVTLALIDRVGPVLERLAALGFEAEATLLHASRLSPLAGGHRLAATNPITIAVGRR